MTLSLRARNAVLLTLAVSFLSACAAYTGPKIGSTAEPPINPPRPEPLEPVYYDHEVHTEGVVLGSTRQVYVQQEQAIAVEGNSGTGYSVNVQEGTVDVRDGAAAGSSSTVVVQAQSEADILAAQISAAYAKRGRPLVATVFYTAADSIRMRPTMVPVMRTERSIAVDGTHTHTKKGDATLDVDISDNETLYLSTGNSVSRAKLVSWSDVQQTTFDVLRTCGIRVTDTEMTTLGQIDHLMGRTAQGLSLHTAELESLRNSVDFEVLILIQEVYEHGDTWLQARAWDLVEGSMVAACRTKLLMGRTSATGELLARHRTRRLATDVLQQASIAWNQM